MKSTDEVVWGGVGVCESTGARIESASVVPPATKTRVVSIPGGADLDLTDALTGHAAFSNRKVTVVFLCDLVGDDFVSVADAVTNMLHGRRAKFTLSWDPGYTYEGRAEVTSVELGPPWGAHVTVEIDASPWRLRQRHTTTVSASGGVTLTCRSGRRPVHPLISCDYPVTVNWEGRQFVVPAGQTYRMADVTFEQGDNRIWLSTFAWRTATWADLASSTWDDLSGIQWARVVVGDQDHGQGVPGDASVTLQWDEAYL